MRFNAMEVINSGATQTDPLRLFRDWMALLNRGYQVTPVGSSDSHDVARYIVGQGRTYIRCDDRDVAHLDVDAAVANFLQGRVLVSYGLLAELTVNGKYSSGELAAIAGDEVDVKVRVLGPHWTEATKLQLYANGQLIREEPIRRPAQGELPLGVQWQVTLEAAAAPARRAPGGDRLGPGDRWTVLDDRQAVSADFARLGAAGDRRERGRVAGWRRRRPAVERT